MHVELTNQYQSVRRAYEYGRLRATWWKALFVAIIVASAGLATSGRSSLAFMPLTLAVWVFAYWRGDAFLRGSLYGLLGGLVTSLLPMSILRPCCVPGAAMGADCCTVPGACLAAGAVVGVALAAVVPFGRASWWRTAIGMAVGMMSVAILKCATLFAGEAVGLVGGLIAGVAAVSAARSLLSRRRAA
jgi:hypothetical protein